MCVCYVCEDTGAEEGIFHHTSVLYKVWICQILYIFLREDIFCVLRTLFAQNSNPLGKDFAPNHCVGAGAIEGRVAVEYINPQPKVAECFAFKCHRDTQNMNGRKMTSVFPVNAISFNAHQGLATAGADGVICLWDVKNRSKIKAFPKCPAPSCITSLAFNTSSSMMVYGNSYDWHKGKGGFNQQLQNTVYVHVVRPDEIKNQKTGNSGFSGGRGW